MANSKKVFIYNLFPRLVGNIKNWYPHSERAIDMGFNMLYINPIHYPGFSGSLYAPKDYYSFNPMFFDAISGSKVEKQLKDFLKWLKKNNVKPIMDLVINHTAIDSVLVEKHPEWYKRNEKGKIENPKAWDNDHWVVWGDLAEIDNENSPDRENLWNYWKDLIIYFMKLGFEGFRCDAAYQVPSALWEFLISSAKKENEEAVFLAETLGCEIDDVIALANAGFDYTFSSLKWWDYNEEWFLKQYFEYREKVSNVGTISFPESHDTNRLSSETGGNINAIKQRYQVCAFFTQGIMITIGFEYGFKKKTDVVHTTPEDWEDISIDLVDFIKNVNTTKAKYNLFMEEGDIDIVDQENWYNVFCYLKTSSHHREKALVMINKDVYNYQRVYFPNLNDVFKWGSRIIDISPEYPMDFVPVNHFEYYLRPGQVKVLYMKLK